LRGGKIPNYGADSVDAAASLLQKSSLRPQLMIDVSHANSDKQHQRQIEVVADVAQQITLGDGHIMGVMIESHLHEGRQDLVAGRPLQHGVSITDPCISFSQTRPLLDLLAQAVRSRRAK